MLIYKSNNPKSNKLIKPKFLKVDEKTELEDLITPESFKFFKILGLNPSWLELSPDKWDDNEDYKSAKEFVTTVKVTNDVAERGIKMAQD